MYLLRDFSEILTLQSARKKLGRWICEEDLSIQKNASILIDREKIVWIGALKNLPKEFKKKKIREISYRHHTLLPGFVECHTHAAFAGNRSAEFESRLQGVSYQEIARRGGGIQSTVKHVRQTSRKELNRLLQRRVDRFVQQGVTTLEVKSGYGLNLKTELELLKTITSIDTIRMVPTFLGPHAFSPDYPDATQYIEDVCAVYLPKIKKLGLCSRADIFIENGFFSTLEGEKYLSTAQNLGFDLAIHAEQLNRTGASLLGVKTGAKSVDHLVQINSEDVKKLSESDITCVLLPLADLYMKLPYPPARSLLDAGARVALATDFNPGTAPSQDLSLTGLLARLHMQMTLPEILSAYTVAPSFALGLENQVGCLQPGFQADLSCILGHWTDLFYEAGGTPVQSVWHAGRKLF